MRAGVAPEAERTAPPAAPVVGVDIGGSKIAYGVVDGAGRVIAARRHPTEAARGPGAVLDGLAEAVIGLAEESGTRVAGVGVGICGQVGSDLGVLRGAPHLPGWRDVPVRERLADTLRLPVAVANDVSVIALGEWAAWRDREVSDLVVVFVGTGVGGGIVAGGELLLGQEGYAAELGHVPIVADGRECPCGGVGCLEAYAGGDAIGRRARRLAERSPGKGARLAELAGSVGGITGETVACGYREGDPLSVRLVEEVGHYLGVGMVGVVNALNPGRLVLGGGVVDGIPDLVERTAVHVRAHALPVCTESLEIVATRLGSDAGIVGGAHLIRRSLQGGGVARR